MNGFGTARTRPLPVGLLSQGWMDANGSENLVVRLLNEAGIRPAYNRASEVLDCYQSYAIGPYTADFAWPKLKIVLEADGSIHQLERRYAADLKRDAHLRELGWLVFRVDTTDKHFARSQVFRVIQVLRALAKTSA